MFFLTNQLRFPVTTLLLSVVAILWMLIPAADGAAPTNIYLTNTVIHENDPDGDLIGTLDAEDADENDFFIYSLVFGAGDSDNESFAVFQNQLLLNYGPVGPNGPHLDYEKQTSYSIRLRARDPAGGIFEKSFVITMINDPLEDEDNDGLNETAEQQLGLSDTKADTDGDGFPDPLEIQKNSLPNNNSSWPDHPLLVWGGNMFGELLAPAAVDFTKISAGQTHSMGLRLNGSVAAWGGWNEHGQVVVPPGLSGVVDVVASEEFWPEEASRSLALKMDGSVVGWGYGDDGEQAVPVGLVDVVEISMGRAHNLALKSNGTVVAWGNGGYGQISLPAGLQGVVAVAAGGFYSLALKSNGTVVAWGSNFDGEEWYPIGVPAGLRDVVAVSAGRFHALALKSDGTVVAWGYGEQGQTLVPQGLAGVVSVKAGGFHSLALKGDGSVVAWGLNDKGQRSVPSAANGQVAAISAGFSHNLALRQSATYPRISSSAQILAPAAQPLSHPVVVTNAVATRFMAVGLPAGLTIHPVTGVITGTASGAVRQTVRILVDTNQGRLTQDLWIRVLQGATPTSVSLSPALVMENSAKDMVVGGFSATDPDGGDTHVYELVDGPGSLDNALFAVSGNNLIVKERLGRDFESNPAAFSIRVRAVDASLNFLEAVIPIQFGDDLQEDIDRDGLVEALELQAGTSDLDYDSENDGFGDGLEIRMGRLPLSASSVPIGQMIVAWGNNDRGQLTVPAGLGEVSQVAGGWAHSMALRVGGTVAAWGWNAKGQTHVPADLAGVVAVSAGYEHSLALKADGTVVAWGDDSKTQTSVPEGLNGVVAIAAGGYFNLALKGDGTVVAWGDDENGETDLPSGLNNVVAIAAGGFHGLALKNDGSVIAWGWSGSTAVPDTASQIVAISAGGIHSMALKRDGTVITWGRNDEGQLDVPETVAPAEDLSTGVYHSMVRKNAGTTLAWGDDEFGQSSAPTDAQSIRFLATAANHNLAIRDSAAFPAFAPRAMVTGWPGQTLNHQVAFSGATVTGYSAMGLPAGLSIHPQTGLISGLVTGNGERKSVRLTVETNKGRISQVLWFNTADGHPPTDLNLTVNPASVIERAPVGTVLGTLGVVDIDAGDTFFFDVEVTSGSTFPFCLSVSGGQLIVTNSSGLNFENGKSGVMKVKIGVTDSGGSYYSETFNIQLSDDRTEDADGDGVNEAMEEDVFFSKDTVKDDYITLDKDGDGISALAEYAFNLNPQVADGGRYLGAVGSTSGLPAIKTFMDPQGQRRLRLEYLRRTGSGLAYIPQFSGDLKTWTQPTPPVSVTWTNGVWERCLIEDYQFTPSPSARFGRVRIDYVPPGATNGLPPTSISLLASLPPGGAPTLMENSPPGTVVGNLNTTDLTPGDTHTYTVAVLSGAPAGSLAIFGSQLVTAAGSSFDFEASPANLSVQIRSTDSTGNFHEQIFIIPLVDDRSEDADGDGMDESTEEDYLFTSDVGSNDFATEDADKDGICTLIEYAFNLDPRASDAGLVVGGVGSASGLPKMYPVIDGQGQGRLRMEYLRRIGSGLDYKPLFSSTMATGSWVSRASAVQVIWSNSAWERCVVDDSESVPGCARRFGQVSVSK